MKINVKSDTNIIVAFTIVYVMIILIFLAFNILTHEKQVIGRFDKTLISGASASLLVFPEGFHDRAVDKTSISSLEDKVNVKKLTELQKLMDLTYIYTVIMKDGKVYFTSSGATLDELKNGTYVRYFTHYNDAPDALKKAFSTGEKTFGEYTDKWGTFRSVFMPMKNSLGDTYVVCSDIETKKILSLQSQILLYSLYFPVIFMVMVVPLIFILRKIRIKDADMLKENKVQLEHASRLTAMGELAAGIAHEINQPLCVLRGYLELLQACLKNDPILKEKQLTNAFDICIKSVEKVSAIIKHMRSFVKLKTDEQLVPVDLKDVLNDALSFFHEQIRLHNIELMTNYEESLPLVKIDPRKFEQIAVNIISNARFALDRKGEQEGRSFLKKLEINLASTADKKEIVLKIIDNGIGMSKEILKRCREPFYSSKHKHEGEGLGLGLSIVEGLVKEAGGRLDISSDEGTSTEVKITLPAAAEL